MLGTRHHEACAFPHREDLVREFGQALTAMRDFYSAAFGTQGLLSARETEDRLVFLIQDQAEQMQRQNNKLTLGATVASIWLFEMAPLGAGVLRGLWGFERLASWPGTVYGMRMSMMAGTGAFVWALREGSKMRSALSAGELVNESWKSQMTEIEAFVEAPWWEAEHSWSLFTLIHAQVLMPEWAWLKTAQWDLYMIDAVKQRPSVFEVRARLEEMGATGGLSVAEQIGWYLQRLHAIGFKVTCDDSWLNGINEWQCFVGLRALFTFAISRGQSQVDESVHITISSRGRWVAFKPEATRAESVFPWNTSDSDLSRFLASQFSDSDFEQRKVMMDRIAELTGRFEKQTGLKFEVESALTLPEGALGLSTLKLLLEHDPNALHFQRIEFVRIGPRAVGLTEKHQLASATVDAHSSFQEMQNFLQRADSTAWIQPGLVPLAQFDGLRAERETLYDSIQNIRICTEGGLQLARRADDSLLRADAQRSE